jgi:hypothetical protein
MSRMRTAATRSHAQPRVSLHGCSACLHGRSHAQPRRDLQRQMGRTCTAAWPCVRAGARTGPGRRAAGSGRGPTDGHLRSTAGHAYILRVRTRNVPVGRCVFAVAAHGRVSTGPPAQTSCAGGAAGARRGPTNGLASWLSTADILAPYSGHLGSLQRTSWLSTADILALYSGHLGSLQRSTLAHPQWPRRAVCSRARAPARDELVEDLQLDTRLGSTAERARCTHILNTHESPLKGHRCR